MTSEIILPTPVMMNGELRIGDLALAETLGFATPVNIRKLIRRHIEYLARFAIISTVDLIRDGAGRPGTEFFLTEEQASYIAMLSQTPQAAEGRINLILGFKAMKQELAARRSGDPALSELARSMAAFGDGLAKIAGAMAGLASRVEALESQKRTQSEGGGRVPLFARVEKQGSLFGLDDEEALAAFQPISVYLDMAEIAPRRRFIGAGRAAQSCASWLMKNGMTGFVRGSHETRRLLFHPEGVLAWKEATGRTSA